MTELLCGHELEIGTPGTVETLVGRTNYFASPFLCRLLALVSK